MRGSLCLETGCHFWNLGGQGGHSRNLCILHMPCSPERERKLHPFPACTQALQSRAACNLPGRATLSHSRLPPGSQSPEPSKSKPRQSASPQRRRHPSLPRPEPPASAFLHQQDPHLEAGGRGRKGACPRPGAWSKRGGGVRAAAVQRTPGNVVPQRPRLRLPQRRVQECGLQLPEALERRPPSYQARRG